MQTDPSATTHRRWRVAVKLPIVKLAAAALLLLTGVLLTDGDPVRLALTILASTALLGWGLRDLLVPVRLTADPEGITVITGLVGRRRLTWSEIERISADTRTRAGLRSQQLEIDIGETVYVLSGYDLGMSPDEVAATLRTLRR